MSAKATFWAWEIRKIGSSPKLVLLCLSDCHNKDTDRCDPSISFISEHTDLDRKTIMKSIAVLEEKGLICVKKRAGARTNYVLNIAPSSEHTSPQTSAKSGTSTKSGTGTENGTATGTNIGTAPVPNLGHEPISNLQENLEVIYRGLDLEKINPKVSRETVKEYIDHRAKIKKPLASEGSLNRIIKKAIQAEADPQLNLSCDDALQTAIDNGWQGFEVNWLKNKNNKNNPQQPAPRREL